MSAEALSVADDMLRSFFERWQRLEEEKQALSGDLKELFAEMKGGGFDTKAARAVFRDENKLANEDAADKADRTEFEAMCELYRASLKRPRAGRARESAINPPTARRPVGGESAKAGAETDGGKDETVTDSQIGKDVGAANGHPVDIDETENATPAGMSGVTAGETATQFEPAPTPPGAATAGVLSDPLATGPVFQSAVPPPQSTAPEPFPQDTHGSGATIPDELIVPHIRKDHEPTNPNCQKPAICKWARSMASCSACAQAAFKARAA